MFRRNHPWLKPSKSSPRFHLNHQQSPIGFAAGTLEKFTALCFAPNGLLVTGRAGRRCAIWDWHDLSKPKFRTGDFSPITAIAFSPDGALIVTAQRSEAPSIAMWDATTGKKVRTMSGLSYAPTALQFQPRWDATARRRWGTALAHRGVHGRHSALLHIGRVHAVESARRHARQDGRGKRRLARLRFLARRHSPRLGREGRGGFANFHMWLGTTVRVWRVPGGGENDNGAFLPNSLSREREAMVHNPDTRHFASRPTSGCWLCSRTSASPCGAAGRGKITP